MDKEQIPRIEEMMMMIPTKICRYMDQQFGNTEGHIYLKSYKSHKLTKGG